MTDPDNRTITSAERKPKVRLPIRIYLILMNLVLLCILFPTISYYFLQKTTSFRDTQLQQTFKDRTASLEQKAAYLSRSISHAGTQAISEYNFSFLNNVIHETVQSDPEIVSCQILGTAAENSPFAGIGIESQLLQGVVTKGRLAQKDTLQFAKKWEETKILPVQKINLDFLSDTTDFPALLFVTPIYVGGTLWGSVNTIFTLEILNKDLEKIEKDWDNQMRQYKISFFSITSVFLILGIFSAIFFTMPLLQSLYRIRDGVILVSSGNLNHKIDHNRINIDEFVSLSRSFNLMTANLRVSRQQLDDYSHSLEKLVDERTSELRKTQAELLSQAHEAGMAEMAVGVLHNIGNAITPAKVGAIVLKDKLESSALRRELDRELVSATRVIGSSTDIPEEKKNRIVSILSLLSGSISEEYNQALEKLQGIIKKHNYIEDIINLQMRYANLQGAAENLNVNKVVMDGLTMLEDVIQQHEILVRTNFHDIPEVCIEESKLLQILINVIKNGCEAMMHNDEKPRILTVSSYQEKENDHLVVLTFKDTGCGFDQETKESLFAFGYSTKRRSSGYGLHSSSNYLIANNGSLEAYSPGPNQGAEFVIRLQPANPAG